MSERVIFKIGGSLLSPYEEAIKRVEVGKVPFDFSFAREFLTLAKNNAEKQYVFVVGGGFLNRWFLQGLRDEHIELDEVKLDQHYIGMASSDIIASVLRILAVEIFGEAAVYPHVVKYGDYESLLEKKEEYARYPVIVAAGWKPGHSHDVDALLFASLFGTNQVVSLKNIDGIYTADPKKVADAVKKRVLTWPEYRAIINTSVHEPGASFPIDAVAAQLAEKMKIGFTVIDGRDLQAVDEVIKTRLSSKGSVVSPE